MGSEEVIYTLDVVAGPPGKDAPPVELNFANLQGNPSDNEALGQYIAQEVETVVTSEFGERISNNELGGYINSKVAEAVEAKFDENLQTTIEEAVKAELQDGEEMEF